LSLNRGLLRAECLDGIAWVMVRSVFVEVE